MPAACAAASAPATCAAMRSASESRIPLPGISSLSGLPSTNSMTMKVCPSCSPISWIVTMLGWLRRCGGARFPLQPFQRSALFHSRPSGRNFNATARDNTRSSARYTTPMPPRPSKLTIRKCSLTKSPGDKTGVAEDSARPRVLEETSSLRHR